MTHRDRAWRRRVSRIQEHRNDEAQEFIKDAKTVPSAERPHRPGKLTQAQAKRQDFQLRYEASDGWTGETVIPTPPESAPIDQP